MIRALGYFGGRRLEGSAKIKNGKQFHRAHEASLALHILLYLKDALTHALSRCPAKRLATSFSAANCKRLKVDRLGRLAKLRLDYCASEPFGARRTQDFKIFDQAKVAMSGDLLTS